MPLSNEVYAENAIAAVETCRHPLCFPPDKPGSIDALSPEQTTRYVKTSWTQPQEVGFKGEWKSLSIRLVGLVFRHVVSFGGLASRVVGFAGWLCCRERRRGRRL